VEINKKEVEISSDMTVIDSKGKSGDMKTIFFGSTFERVLRFITRPVLCVPPEMDYRVAKK
jgi:nucleotide-binding universal stress UspA family protein